MKNLAFGFGSVVVAAVLHGCVSAGPAPQDVPLQSPDGKAVIIKDVYEEAGLKTEELGKTEIIKVFYPKIDNIKCDFSTTVLKMPPGTAQPKHKQTSSQIICTLSGGGKLQIENNIIVLKKGIMVYVPPNAVMSITNDIGENLELTVLTTPPFMPSQVEILEPAPKNLKVAKKEETKMDESIDIQAVSEKYKTQKEQRKYLSVEEYRKKIENNPNPLPTEKDSLSELLDSKDIDTKSDTWPMQLPDDSKTPLNTLEKEQEDNLIPEKPMNLKDVSTKKVQQLSPAEHTEKISSDDVKSSDDKLKTSAKEPDSLEKLLKEQEEKEKKLKKQAEEDAKLKEDIEKTKQQIPAKKVGTVKKTSMQHVQELSPEEDSASSNK